MDELHLEADRIFGPCGDPECPGATIRQTPAAEGPYARAVTLTRRTRRFGELAEGIEERLAPLGVEVEAAEVDAVLRERIRAAAEPLGLSDRAALRYVPEHLADEIAKAYVLAFREAGELVDDPRSTRARRHLHLVREEEEPMILGASREPPPPAAED